MVPGSPRFSLVNDPKCQPHHLEQIHQKYVAVFIFKFWSSANDCSLIKLCCGGILMSNAALVLKQSINSCGILNVLLLSFFIPIFPHLQKPRTSKSYVHVEARLCPEVCHVTFHLKKHLAHKLLHAPGTLSSAKTNFQSEVFDWYSWPTAAVFTRRCWPADGAFPLEHRWTKKTCSCAYLMLFFCWACHPSHRYISSPHISIKRFLCD